MDVKQTQRVTVTFRPGIYRALKASAVRNKRTISEVVNEAVERALREDALDAKAFHKTRKAFDSILESSDSFEARGTLVVDL